MALTVGSGPFGHQPAGQFNRRLPEFEGLLYLEPSSRRIRGEFAGEMIVDSRATSLLYEHGRLPVYVFPQDDVRMDLLVAEGTGEASENKGEQRTFTLRVGDAEARDAAWAYPEPPAEAAALAGLIGFRWASLEQWYEEDEPAIVHARDPYHRVDVVDTSRAIRFSLAGEVLAETQRGRVLFETSLPPRWYLPPEDVRRELLVESDLRTGCAYKGFASYWSARLGNEVERDIAWSYAEPRHDATRVAGYVAFFNERTDLEIDGELQERPLTPWSPDWKGVRPETSL